MEGAKSSRTLLPSQTVVALSHVAGNEIAVHKRHSVSVIEYQLDGTARIQYEHNLDCLLISTTSDGRVVAVTNDRSVMLLSSGEAALIGQLPNHFNCCPITSRHGDLVSICANERFVYTVDLDSREQRLIDYGSGRVILGTVTVRHLGCSYLLTFFLGSLEGSADVTVLSLRDMCSFTAALPPGFLYPTRYLLIPNTGRIYVFSGPSYILIELDFEGGRAAVSGPTTIFANLRCNDPIRLVESVSNVFYTEETCSFVLSWNSGDLTVCSVSKDSQKISIRSVEIKTALEGSAVLENGLLIGYSVAKGTKIYRIFPETGENPRLIASPMETSIIHDLCCDFRGRADEEIFLACGVGERALVGSFQEDIPVKVEIKSDQLFRGCTGIWMLREYNSDKHHSMLAVSFVQSTVLLKLTTDINTSSLGGCMEDISQYYGLDMYQRTLAMENSETGSFLIQVCPKRILIFKSNYSETTREVVVAEWRVDGSYGGKEFSSARIIKDLVFALDSQSSLLSIFYCRTTRGAAGITLITTLGVPLRSVAFAVNLLCDSEKSTKLGANYILVVGTLEGNQSCLHFWRAVLGPNTSQLDLLQVLPFEEDQAVNEMQFLRDSTLVVGLRSGLVLIFSFSGIRGSFSVQKNCSLVAGTRPVQLLCTHLSGLTPRIITLAGPASLLAEDGSGGFDICRIVPRADHIVRWAMADQLSLDKEIHRFVLIEHESMVLISTPLVFITRICPVIFSTCSRRILAKGGLLIAISSPNQVEQDSLYPSGLWTNSEPVVEVYSRQDEETQLRTTLSAGDIITCGMVIPGTDLVAIGMRVQNVGQLRILRIPFTDKSSRRRASMSSIQLRMNMPQLIFSCDAGFPHPVTAMTWIQSTAGENVHKLLVAAGSELHLMHLNLIEEGLDFVRTESWRSLIKAVSASPNSRLIAICTQRGGIEIAALKEGGEEGEDKNHIELVRCWSSPLPDLIDRILWCTNTLLAASDRRGLIHLFSVCADSGVVLEKQTVPTNDIPFALAMRKSKNCLLYSTITGGICEIKL